MPDQLFAHFGRDFAAGEVLFQEGEVGNHMFVIQSGQVRVSKRIGPNEKVLAVLGASEFVGEMAILNGKPRTATATVVEAAQCLIISAKTLEAMISKNSEIALRLIKKLASRLDSADALVEILMHQDPRIRVILALSRLAETVGQPVEDGVRLTVGAGDISNDIGVDRAIVEEVLGRLRRLRLLRDGPDGALDVVGGDRLRDFLEFLEIPARPQAGG